MDSDKTPGNSDVPGTVEIDSLHVSFLYVRTVLNYLNQLVWSLFRNHGKPQELQIVKLPLLDHLTVILAVGSHSSARTEEASKLN